MTGQRVGVCLTAAYGGTAKVGFWLARVRVGANCIYGTMALGGGIASWRSKQQVGAVEA